MRSFDSLSYLRIIMNILGNTDAFLLWTHVQYLLLCDKKYDKNGMIKYDMQIA